MTFTIANLDYVWEEKATHFLLGQRIEGSLKNLFCQSLTLFRRNDLALKFKEAF